MKGPGQVVPGTIKDGGPRFKGGSSPRGGQLPASSVRADGTHKVKMGSSKRSYSGGAKGVGNSAYGTSKGVGDNDE